MTFDLPALGFGPFFQAQLERWQNPSLAPGRIAAEHRGRYTVWSAEGAVPARISNRLRRQLADQAFPTVGDWVVFDPATRAGDAMLIEGVFDRRTVFERGKAGRQARPQVVGANVDRVFVVCAFDAGINLHRIERYVARIWAGGAEPAIILSKADLCGDLPAAIARVEQRFPLVQVHATTATSAEGLAQVRAAIPEGCTAALVGSSGAGKSTLVNALLGEERMATGETQAGTGRGRHVTTRREMALLPGGGVLLDTPGMRELQLVDEEGLGAVFGDIAALAGHCRFRDCTHGSEPGCAVRQALASGELEAERLEHFLKLESEARAYELRHDARLRRQAGRVWGQLYDEVRQLNRWKGK